MYLRYSRDLMFTILSRSPCGVDLGRFISVLIANWLENSSLLESPDESPTKAGAQYSKCGKMKAL